MYFGLFISLETEKVTSGLRLFWATRTLLIKGEAVVDRILGYNRMCTHFYCDLFMFCRHLLLKARGRRAL